ncbi:MAG: WecB/TagA/CpsF family glycosyltransferase [Candidatus Subteraquimicrobiales bacterium]|nr:WecB/TagA/CpsF family glycosyltransferase [Candidatus Subteraquimicrobiales bacterium]
MNNRLSILNIWVDPVNKEEAIDKVKSFLKWADRPHSIFASNPEKNFSVPKDPLLYETFKKADLLLPDGIGMVLAARILYGARLTRVPGSEFIFDICELAAEEGHRVFIYGAKEEVNRAATETLKSRYAGLEIAGRSSGYVKEEEMPDLINRINKSEAEILFLALGSPKQEKWLAKYKDRLETVRVCQGIGGTLDVIAGKVKRAPDIWLKLGIEWLYRLLAEPRRIKRQWVLPLFAAEVLLAKLRMIFSSEPGKTSQNP